MEITIKYSINELASILRMTRKRTKKIAKSLNFELKDKFYHFSKNDPLIQSIKLCNETAKPVYTIIELSKIWIWKKQYSTRWVRHLLEKYNIPLYCGQGRGKIGLIYLKDILKLNNIYDNN